MEIGLHQATRGLNTGRSTRQYVLRFHSNSLGVSKRVELASETAKAALELAISDVAKRTVDVWQDGEFLCRVSRERALARFKTGEARIQ